MTEVITARGLRKEFTVHVKTGRIRRARRVRAAVDGLDLRVERARCSASSDRTARASPPR